MKNFWLTNNCKICNKKISYNAILCKSCANKGKNNPMFGIHRFREKNPCWAGGFPKCINCGKEVKSRYAKQCQECYHKNKIVISNFKRFYYKGIYFKSSYEFKYAKYLDNKNIKWLYESKIFDLGSCSYRPDFYLPKTYTYIEIKGYWRDDAKKKFKLFKKIYKNIKIKVLNKLILQEIGVL